jgi:E3 ubiquitin-protein ligase RNF14
MEGINNIPIINNIKQEQTRNKGENDEDINTRPDLLIYYKNLDSPESQKEIESFMYMLEDMGYKRQIIFRSYLVHRYRDVSEAIDLLSKTQNLWNHKFIDGFNNKCFICDDFKNSHKSPVSLVDEDNFNSYESNGMLNIGSDKINEAIIKVRHSQQFTFNNFNEIYKSEEKETDCPICFTEFQDNNEVKLSCDHKFCRDCLISFLEEEIRNSRVNFIKCPQSNCVNGDPAGTAFIFSDDLIKKFLSENLFEKYLEFKQKLIIENDPSLTFCPIPNCKGYAKKEIKKEDRNNLENDKEPNDEEKVGFLESMKNVILDVSNDVDAVKMTCNFEHEFCFKCKNIWEKNHKCERDSDIVKYSNENKENVKRCPKCKNWIEKNKGCNHMTCIICKYEFCWLCMEESLPDHYNNLNSPCYGKQFPDEEINPRMREAIEGLQNSSVFFYIFSLTFFLIKFFHNIFFNQNNNREEGREGSKFLFFCFISMILIFSWFILIFINGVLLASMIKCIPMLYLANTNERAHRVLKNSIFYISTTYVILWFLYFIPGILFTTFWLLISLAYLLWVTLFY